MMPVAPQITDDRSSNDAKAPPDAVRRQQESRRRGWLTIVVRKTRRILRRIAWATQLVASAVVLIGVLAVLAAIPVLGLYVLGYFLAAEGRVGRGERWRNVLPWIRYAPRIAAIACGTSLIILPIVVLSDFARDASLINPDGAAARSLRLAVSIVSAAAVVHLFLAYARGGSLMSYVRPIKNARVALRQWRSGRFGRTIADRLGRAFVELQTVALFWKGARGLTVAAVWLFIPCSLIAASGPADGGRLLMKLLGALLLSAVFPALLIAQAHFAVRNRLRSGFAPIESLRLFGRAPLAWLIAGTLTAGLALPLFLFKIVAPPRDAFWMLTPLFVAAMLPARIVTGWAYRRAARRERRGSFVMIGLATVCLLVVGLAYSSGVFAAQYINEHGRRAVFEQHAFSLPVPF